MTEDERQAKLARLEAEMSPKELEIAKMIVEILAPLNDQERAATLNRSVSRIEGGKRFREIFGDQ